MKYLISAIVLALGAGVLPGTTFAQQKDDQPKITEETPYVPSPKIVVDTMLSMAGVRSGDFLIDLGSGDGRIIITAVQQFKVSGFGVDYDPRLVRLANENARKAGVADRASFIERDIFKTDLSKASVVTMYLLPEYNAVLKPTLLALKPGTRIVSHDYGIADWEPDAKEKVLVPEKPVGVDKASWIYYWMVPAQVEGSWRSRIPAAKGTADLELKITQRYQKFDGTARIGASTFAIERPVLKGTEISFDIIDGRQTLHFAGRVSEGRLSGQVTAGGRKHPWSAQKVEPSKV